MTAENHSVWVKYLSVSERSYWVLSKNGMVSTLVMVNTFREIMREEIQKNCSASKNSCIFKDWHLANGSSESNNVYNFLKDPIKIFQTYLNILPKLWVFVIAENTKNRPFLTF